MTWTLVLGAGASAAAPTRLPLFVQIRNALLEAMGWHPVETSSTLIGPNQTNGAAYRLRNYPGLDGSLFPSLDARRLQHGMPPELLFGTLARFGVRFADDIERLMLPYGAHPAFNAAHVVAANVLADDGMVWTPNIDTAVEAAHRHLHGVTPERVTTGGLLAGGRRERPRYRDASPGTLVKFHGSADVHASLAFSDLELLAPIAESDASHLIELARGSDLVILGWAGADLDLRDLMIGAMRSARSTTWFEPATDRHEAYRSLFPNDCVIDFRPAVDAAIPGFKLRANAEAFLQFADEASLRNY